MEGELREKNWSDAVENLVERDDVDGAIEAAESLVSRLGSLDLASTSSAVYNLANLLDSRGISERSDHSRRQIPILREKINGARDSITLAHELREREDKPAQEITCSSAANREDGGRDDDVDDWETAADRPLPDFLGTCSSQESKDVKTESPPRRRGRGHFQYKKDELYSDQINDYDEDFNLRERRETSDISSSSCASFKHVLVLQDFPRSIRTTDLEKIFEAFSEEGLAIRWVHDTCALAVFRTPSLARRAFSSTSCPFKIRMIDDSSDAILAQISSRELEPPQLRPKASARAAQRMIAQSMGIKINSSFGSKELRTQERERKNRIQARHGLRADSWGPEDP